MNNFFTRIFKRARVIFACVLVYFGFGLFFDGNKAGLLLIIPGYALAAWVVIELMKKNK